ncbi:MAG: hypothetical protein AB7O96_15785 [Pseudobdellovibrionaceae bacterium]
MTHTFWLFPLAYFAWNTGTLNANWLGLALILGVTHLLSPLLLTYWLGPSGQKPLAQKKNLILGTASILVSTFLLFFVGMLQLYGTLPKWNSVGVDVFIWLGIIYFFWNTWHVCGQFFGILSLYRIRAGMTSKVDILYDKWFCRFMLCFCVPASLLLRMKGRSVRPFAELDFFPKTISISASWILVPTLIGLTAILLREFRKTEAFSWPRVSYILNIGLIPILGLAISPMYFFFILDMNHWISDISLSSKVASSHYFENKKTGFSGQKFSGFFLFLTLFLFVGGTYWLLGCKLSGLRCSHVVYDIRVPVFGMSHAAQLSFLMGTHFGLSLLHFFLSARIYRLSEPLYGKNLQSLIFGEKTVP